MRQPHPLWSIVDKLSEVRRNLVWNREKETSVCWKWNLGGGEEKHAAHDDFRWSQMPTFRWKSQIESRFRRIAYLILRLGYSQYVSPYVQSYDERRTGLAQWRPWGVSVRLAQLNSRILLLYISPIPTEVFLTWGFSFFFFSSLSLILQIVLYPDPPY